MRLISVILLILLPALAGCVNSILIPWCSNPTWKIDCVETRSPKDGKASSSGSSSNGTSNGSSTSNSAGQNNGFGNGDQDAPGRSASHNNAENDPGGRADPSHGKK